MKLRWASSGFSDLARLHDFLFPVNPHAAAEVVRTLVTGVAALKKHPRLGEKLEQYEPREIRSVFVGSYELRYEIDDGTIYVLRIWHTREKR